MTAVDKSFTGILEEDLGAGAEYAAVKLPSGEVVQVIPCGFRGYRGSECLVIEQNGRLYLAWTEPLRLNIVQPLEVTEYHEAMKWSGKFEFNEHASLGGSVRMMAEMIHLLCPDVNEQTRVYGIVMGKRSAKLKETNGQSSEWF